MSKIITSNYYEIINGTTMYHEDYVEQLQKENEELKKYCCKRNDCGGRIKENNKPTDAEVLERLETWCKTQIDKLTDKAVSYGLFINKDVKYEIDLQISIYNKFLNTIKEFKG